jgi:hypothetical protein
MLRAHIQKWGFLLAGDPIVNEPAGTTTISGQFSHSRKLFFGLRPRSWAGVNAAAETGGWDSASKHFRRSLSDLTSLQSAIVAASGS